MKKSAILVVCVIAFAAAGLAAFAEDESAPDPVLGIAPPIDRKNPGGGINRRSPTPKKPGSRATAPDPGFSAPGASRPGSISGETNSQSPSPGGSGSAASPASSGALPETNTGQDSRSILAGIEPEKLQKADPDIMRMIDLLAREIERDRAITTGDLSQEGLDRFRASLPGDMERKKSATAAITSKSGVSQVLDLIDRTIILEEDIISSKSKSSEKRRQTQRHTLQGLGYKKEALEILKSKIKS